MNSVNEKPLAVVSEPLEDHAHKYLSEHCRIVKTTADKVMDHIAEAEALVVRTYTQVDEKLLAAAPKLKVVGRAGVALENINVPACRAAGVEVVHTPAANTLAVVDFTMSMILMMNRRYWLIDPQNPPLGDAFHKLRKQAYGRFLSEATLGIIGVGRIGSRVARAAAGLGMRVLYNDILPIELDCGTSVDKETLYAESDIITIHVPVTKLTHGMINDEVLAKFKPGAQFVNAARGECMDADALARAWQAGKLSGMAIDTHSPEPPAADYSLYGLEGDNIFLTPHIAARVPAATAAMCDVVFDVVKVLNGQKPQYAAAEGSY